MELWKSAEYDAHEQVCLFTDPHTSLRAIVAIHSTALGDAAGGTRFMAYPSDSAALDDALRLSRAMSYKSALADLPIGGGKAVIIGDPSHLKSRDLLLSYGRFIDRLNGSFVTGEDVGISGADVSTMREATRYVGSGTGGDPSVHTATGVMHGLRAVAERRFGTPELTGLRIAIQGLGAVGWGVAEHLHAAGAALVVSDIDPSKVEAAVSSFGAVAVPTEMIHRAEVDIYCPCALGGVINDQSAEEIVGGAVAGAANNQLASASAGERLAQRGILFAPDYVLNAGGIISGLEAVMALKGRSSEITAPLEERLQKIRNRLSEIFDLAAEIGRPPEQAAEMLARRLIGR